MTVSLTWPFSTLPPRKITSDIVAATVSGGRTLTAVEQPVASDAGYWQIVFDEIPLASDAQKRAWKSMSAQLQGRLNPITVPLSEDFWPSTVMAVNANAALGATTIVLNLTSGSAPQSGQPFSIPGASYDRAYRIVGTPSLSGGHYTCTINPPLREAITTSSVPNFNTPKLTCRLATDRELETGVDDYAARTLAKVTFVEALP